MPRPKLTVHEGGEGGPVPRPVVVIRQGHRTQAIDEAEAHLVKFDRELWQRSDKVVRVAPQPVWVIGEEEVELLRVVPLTVELMRMRFSLACDLRKIDRRTKEAVTVDCPKDFAAAYLDMIGRWRLPLLRAIVTAPTIRRDGSLLVQPGFDAKSGIYFDPRGVRYPTIPTAPSEAEARKALDLLLQAIAGFDLVHDVDRAAALSLLITPIVLPALDAAPLHAVTAPVAGSGKTKLVKVASIIATGAPMPVLALGERREESEKRLGAVLIGGAPMVCLDNLERPLMGELLCQAITEPWVATRVLGASEIAAKMNAVLFTATGNNLALYGDMVRRVLMIRLDPRCERPELREFEGPDPCEFAAVRRPDLVAATPTIVRAHQIAGRPRARGPVGSFERWSEIVRDALEWLGCADAGAAMGEARRDDRVLSTARAVIATWHATVGDKRVSARELAELSEQQGVNGWSYPEFRNALMVVAADGGKVSGRRLGMWLAKAKNRIVDGYRIEDAGVIDGITRWRVVAVATRAVEPVA